MDFKKSEWNGFERLDFCFEGRNCVVVLPKAKGSNLKWLLKTEYFGAFCQFELDMLSKGYGLAFLQNETRWHTAADDDAKARFCDFLKEKFGFAEKCLPVGMSCGGMHAVYFASKYPKRVAAIYLDAPVLNLLSCPCGVGHATNEMYLEFCRDTGLTVSELINYRNHPIDCVQKLIDCKIPLFLVCGDSDNIVPYCENGEILAKLYEKTDVPFKKIIKPGCGHHPHGLDDTAPLVRFFGDVY